MRSLGVTKPSRWWEEGSREIEVQDTSSRRQRPEEQEPYTPFDTLKQQHEAEFQQIKTIQEKGMKHLEYEHV
jgi:hypothetical protein